MAHDAFEWSLSDSAHSREQGRQQPDPAGARSLGRQVRDVQDVLAHLLNEIENTKSLALSNQERLENVGRLERQVAEIGRAEEILRRAADQRHRHAAPKPKRDRHGLRVIPGGLAALVPAALLAHDGNLPVAWGVCRAVRAVWRSHRHAMAAAVLLAAIGGATGGSVAANIEHAYGRALVPPGTHARGRRPQRAPVPLPFAAAPLGAHHRHCHDHDQVAVLVSGAERCRETGRDSRAVAGASPSPSPSPAGTTPAPGPTAPVPTPTLPVPTPTLPVPTPTLPVPTPTLPVPTPSATGPAGMVCQLPPPLCPAGTIGA